MTTRGRYKYLILFLIAGFAFLLFGMDAGAASTKKKQTFPFSIKWVGQFAGSKDFQKKESFFSGILNLITGSGSFTLKRPVAVWNDPQGRMCILDQEMQSLLFIRQEKRAIESAFPFPSLVSLCMTKSGILFFTDSRRNQIFIQETPEKKPGY